jgi:hypothetical protein
LDGWGKVHQSDWLPKGLNGFAPDSVALRGDAEHFVKCLALKISVEREQILLTVEHLRGTFVAGGVMRGMIYEAGVIDETL